MDDDETTVETVIVQPAGEVKRWAVVRDDGTVENVILADDSFVADHVRTRGHDAIELTGKEPEPVSPGDQYDARSGLFLRAKPASE